MSLKLCVVIPAYNASETIRQVIKGALKHVSLVIVADDASTDNTARLAAEAGAEVISIKKNQGKGHALKLLFKKAMDKGHDAVISMDADSQHDPEEIPHFIEAHNAYPDAIIVGSRMYEKDKIPSVRYNAMHVVRFYISLAANQFIEDTQCGFRLYPLALIKKMVLTTDGYVTETEILMKAGDLGALIRTVRISTIYSNISSHFRPVLDVAAITIYLVDSLPIKWFIEGLSSGRIYTYAPNNIRDLIGKHKILDRHFQVFALFIIFPIMLLILLAYTFSPLFIKNNFASVRKLNYGFFTITLSAFMLPGILIVGIIEKSCGMVGFKVNLATRFIKKFYPHLWGSEKEYLK
jgi:glycosyltransferase involved in cell wall biosynthesis